MALAFQLGFSALPGTPLDARSETCTVRLPRRRMRVQHAPDAPIMEVALPGDVFRELMPERFAEARVAFGFPNARSYHATLAHPLAGRGAAPEQPVWPTLRSMQSAGKSGASFLASSNSRVLLKSMTRYEARLLLRILPDYLAHVCCRPDTLLPRYLGMCVPSAGAGLAAEECRARQAAHPQPTAPPLLEGVTRRPPLPAHCACRRMLPLRYCVGGKYWLASSSFYWHGRIGIALRP